MYFFEIGAVLAARCCYDGLHGSDGSSPTLLSEAGQDGFDGREASDRAYKWAVVAMVFLVWLPKFLFEKFNMSLTAAGFSATAYLQVASVLGVLCGGILADRLARRYRGGRMMTQALGLICGVPFIFVVGWTQQVPLLIAAMTCFGLFKGLYDSNIWASLHDVVPPERRATAVGVINSIGWLGAGAATVTIAVASQRFDMSVCISATSLIYLFLAFLLESLTE